MSITTSQRDNGALTGTVRRRPCGRLLRVKLLGGFADRSSVTSDTNLILAQLAFLGTGCTSYLVPVAGKTKPDLVGLHNIILIKKKIFELFYGSTENLNSNYLGVT